MLEKLKNLKINANISSTKDLLNFLFYWEKKNQDAWKVISKNNYALITKELDNKLLPNEKQSLHIILSGLEIL